MKNPEEMVESDLPLVRQMYADMGMEYPFPPLGSPLFALRLVVRDDNGDIVGSAAVKVVGEAFVWADPKRSDTERAKAILTLATEAESRARALGLDEVSAWIPPRIEARFSKFLVKLGWIKSPWSNWTRLL